MISLSRLLVALEDAGVLHGDLTEDNLIVVGDSKVVIGDLSGACVAGSFDLGISCATLVDQLHGSAFRHAPEMEGGVPTDPASNVWQMGLVFGKILLGGDLLTRTQTFRMHAALDDRTAEGRENIREAVRQHFNFKRTIEFESMQRHRELKTIVEGMLQKDPAKRWSAKQVYGRLVSYASQLGMSMTMRRLTGTLPREWNEDVE
mmetsp:Transcript_125672/g.363615  ORF Transcript_125672/g.363615 Transcript_125672/m.363615 type:complete len:204 (+) Transcript_125672:22-633(+)